MARSSLIFGRVMRNLNKFITVDDTHSDFVYDDMNEAQKTIISRIITEQAFDITLVKDQEDYPLSAISGAIRNIKDFILPDDWDIPIVLVDSSEWNDIIHSDVTSEQPLFATTFDNTLKLYPMNNIVGGELLETWCYLQAPLTTIAEAVEPELPNIWDKAIELYATAQALSPKDAAPYMAQFEDQIDKLASNGYITNAVQTIEGNW